MRCEKAILYRPGSIEPAIDRTSGPVDCMRMPTGSANVDIQAPDVKSLACREINGLGRLASQEITQLLISSLFQRRAHTPFVLV